MDGSDSTTPAPGTVPPSPGLSTAFTAFTASSTGSSSTPWDPPIQPLQERADRSGWYWALGGGGLLLVLLFVLAVLYRRGLIFNGGAWKRRPSHAQPWKHWGDAGSRMPSLFDLLHVPPRRKSTMNLPVNLSVSQPDVEGAFSAQHDDSDRAQCEAPARSISSIAVHLRSNEAHGRPASPLPPPHHQPLGAINE